MANAVANGSAMKAAYNATDCQKGGTTHSKIGFSNSLVCSYPPHLHKTSLFLFFCLF